MDKVKYLNELIELNKWADTEMAHSRADEILCEILTELGYVDIVNAWQKLDKWYA